MNARVQAADGCPADAMNKLAAFLGLARRYVSAAEDELRSLAALKVRERRARWTGGHGDATSLQHWFGPYSDARFRFVARVFAESRKRLHEGFDFGGKRQPMLIK